MAIDLSVDLLGFRLGGPLVLASGIWGTGAGTIVRAARQGASAVTTKSCSLEPRMGHPNPTVLDWGHGLINAVGLSNPGAMSERTTLETVRKDLEGTDVVVIASVFGDTADRFAQAVSVVTMAEPDIIELNISCPNVESEFGRPFALDPGEAARVTRAVREIYIGPLLVKLSPNAPDIVSVGRAVVEAGADGLTAVNTLGPGMIIDVRARRPILANRVGGVSGPALRPVAVRCVYDLARALSVPIVGVGGISSGRDALEMIMAGATAVGIGSAFCAAEVPVFARIEAEMAALMQQEGIEALDEIRGCAHV